MTKQKVDEYFDTRKQWPAELQRLREILAGTPLAEEYKWRQPCYTFDGGNVLILGEFKDGARVTWFKGALLDDPDGLLEPVGDNSVAGRVLKYTDVDDIDEKVLLGFVEQAIANEKAGRKVDAPEKKELELPDELVAAFDEVDGLREAWDALTPGRQRSWVLHISDAKKAETRAARVERGVPKIFEGKGQLER